MKKGAAPGGSPASPSAFGLTPLPHSCHGFGLRPNRASPFFSQPLSCLCAPFGAGFPCPCQFGRVGKTHSRGTPKMPGRRHPRALIPQTPPTPPPESSTLALSTRRFGTAALRLPCGASGVRLRYRLIFRATVRFLALNTSDIPSRFIAECNEGAQRPIRQQPG